MSSFFHSPDLAGRFLDDGRLQLLDCIGTGVHGVVYRALSIPSRDQPSEYRAVKCIRKPTNGETRLSEFANHAKVSNHNNITTLHHVFRDEIFIYAELDLCPDGTLLDAINRRQIFHNQPDLVRAAFLQLVDAVHHCHEQGVFHRDLKPENILCSFDGSYLRLVDFGMSTDTWVSEDFGRGSECYMSPECLAEEFKLPDYSVRQSDIWSLGILMINILCARSPWERAASSHKHFNDFLQDPNYLRTVLPISYEVQSVVKSILTIDPMSRISLPKLRGRVGTIDTWYMSDKDLAHAAPSVQWVAQYYASEIPSSSSVPNISVTSSASSTGSQSSSHSQSSGEEGFLYPSPALGLEPLEMHEPQPILARIARSLSSDSSSSSSDEESEGPVTPYSLPVDPDIEVPELGEEEGIGASLRVPLFSPTKGVNGSRGFRSASWTSNGGRKLLEVERPRPRAISGFDARMDRE
ncbi:serine/threonine protein kinase, negative regulator of sexual conjugation and meiosis [Armillaria borealis]|uniref:Serine/threonine protein kinase, negative regulator of sexual conjugation and meiosis n=1 Tax=Armillaria borealis TaxID=47425 RepID=A0AA39K2T5_9AGAR|nr:serine/threonine protein kinase, negative regulator of sexual conjugation and meiosis [Armillaria borealis]